MASSALLDPGARIAPGRPFAEREEPRPGPHDRAAEFLAANLLRPVRDRLRDPARDLRRIVAEVARHDGAYRDTPDAALRDHARVLRGRLRRDGFGLAGAGAAFALVQEAGCRALGKRFYPTQLMAGWALLQGRFIEMATGEGKTFAATLPAATVALAGYPVHVVTVNDYLVQRDAAEMGPLYRLLGIEAGAVVEGMERPERRRAYACGVTYCTNKELAFDYLRDGLDMQGHASRAHVALRRLGGEAAEGPVLRGLHFAVVDEADSVFIDEARTPLILSAGTGGDDGALYAEALDLARDLVPGEDCAIDLAERHVALTVAGRQRLADWAEDRAGAWTSTRAREELAAQALAAIALYRRDEHYVVGDGRVQIVDESTGRLMPDRSWERGLHQLIEVKEGCAPTARRETLARITYQRLFRRYLRLAGMSGTASEVAREIRAVYGIGAVRIPLHRASRRRTLPTRILATRAEKWRVVAGAVSAAVAAGRPVLIGTRSVQASEEISAVLTAHGIAHALLNAKQDGEEATIVAAAGEAGRVTVATNMAGRGTDIHLGAGVADRGGLHVILTEFHDSRRIDRQLFGRCARQGDPGSCEAIVALDDDIYAVNAPRLARRVAALEGGARVAGHALLRRAAQHAAEHRAARARMHALRTDPRVDQLLAFARRGA